MDQNVKIGIIGGYGSIGVIVAEELIVNSGYRIIIGGRNPNKVDRLVKKLGERATGLQVNVENDASLKKFCNECSLVINCTGPSSAIKDRIIKVSMDANCDYVDPGIWFDKEKKYGREFEERGLIGLLYAGWIPGLTGILPRYHYMKSADKFDRIKSMNVYCGDKSAWSKNASIDIIYHFVRGISTGYFSYGKWILKNPLFALLGTKFYKYPGNIGRYMVSPVYAVELEALANELYLPRIGFYVGIVGFVTLLKLLFVRYIDIDDENAARIVMRALKRESDKHGPGGAITCDIIGETGRKRTKITASLFEKDTIRLTALCVVISVKLILEKKIKRSGLHLLGDAVDPVLFFKELDKYGICCNVEINNSY